MALCIPDNATVLFQGDSITDAGRSREDNAQLGVGYPNMVAAWFTAMYPEKDVTFLNRGISGNRVKDLKARWSDECIALKPDVVSILIGVNDVWRRYDKNDPTSVESYETDYREILTRVRDELDAEIIILEPFVLPFPEDRVAWREDLDPKIDAARRLAREFNATYVPLDGLFAAAATQAAPAVWAADGVHPSQTGHALIAQSWLAEVDA